MKQKQSRSYDEPGIDEVDTTMTLQTVAA